MIEKSYHGEKNNAVGFAMAGKFLALNCGWVYNTNQQDEKVGDVGVGDSTTQNKFGHRWAKFVTVSK